MASQAAGLFVIAPAKAQVAAATQGSAPNSRLLSTEEGRTIADAARESGSKGTRRRECSHLVHQTYLEAGFEYPYASSFELYAGDDNFERVRHPQPGDLIVWRAMWVSSWNRWRNSFYSLVSTGPEAQNYEGAIGSRAARPRFYRYKVENAQILTAAKAPTPVRASSSRKARSLRRC